MAHEEEEDGDDELREEEEQRNVCGIQHPFVPTKMSEHGEYAHFYPSSRNDHLNMKAR